MSNDLDRQLAELTRAMTKDLSTIGDPSPSSWIPTPLGTEFVDETPPTILKIAGGSFLLYRERTHSLIGESSTGKTWVAILALAEVLNSGGNVLWLDYESTRNAFMARLSSMSVPVESWQRITYLNPREALWDRKLNVGTIHSANLSELISGTSYDLAVIDSVTGAMSVEGLDPMGGTDVETIFRILAGKIAETGSAVLMLDHVTKSQEGRGRYAIGSERKLSGITGASYLLQVETPWKRATMDPISGSFTLKVAKDRTGQIGAEGEIVTKGIVTSDPDGGFRIRLNLPETTNLIPPTKDLDALIVCLRRLKVATRTSLEKEMTIRATSTRRARDYLIDLGAIVSPDGSKLSLNEERIRELEL